MFGNARCMSICLNKFIAIVDLTPINPIVYFSLTKLTCIYALAVHK